MSGHRQKKRKRSLLPAGAIRLAYFDADDDEVIGARNIYKALEEAEYVQGRSFDMIKEQLDRDGIVAANIMLNQTEYYYCLTSLKDYDMTLMLLIPADCVAVSTMDMMNSAVRTETIFIPASNEPSSRTCADIWRLPQKVPSSTICLMTSEPL